MEYLIRLVHVHESFRKPELYSLAILAGLDLEITHYDSESPFCLLRLQSDEAAKKLIERSINSYDIYELWACGDNYDEVHLNLQANATIPLADYRDVSFRFHVDCFKGKRGQTDQRRLIESFSYLGFDGPIVMNGAQLEVCIFEDYERLAPEPKKIYIGRWIAKSARDAIVKYDLKKRRYISRTSMDAELSLLIANLTLAAPGKIFYDPFVGTGSFSVACSHFGAISLGSDIDGRSIRGHDGKSLLSNFESYDLTANLLDNFIADLTHSPVREVRFLDGIVCDPPYGIREGAKVLGHKDRREVDEVYIDGKPAHTLGTYVHPKRPYGFDDMLNDVLEFAYQTLVDNGRLSMWMPTADDNDAEIGIPTHPGLELLSSCIQNFNKWARRLLTYRRLPASQTNGITIRRERDRAVGNADDIQPFRKKYFEGFRS